MKTIITALVACVAFSGASLADENANLVVNGEDEMIIRATAADDSPLDEILSGWLFRTAETQSLQMDDFDNPGFVFVEQAEDLFAAADGSEGKACADCHADVADFAGLRTVLPRWDETDGKMMTMENYINECRTERMGAKAWKYSGADMTGMTALISLQSRGMPIAVETGGKAAAAYELGKELYYTRVGQLDMACSNCHEDNYGNMIRADHLSQGQTNGFPTYRLKNAKLNSIHGRFKGCMNNIRATPYKEGSPEFTAIELYVASRGAGLSSEAPSVRN